MIGCFFAYHCSLIAKGMTSYETFKWQDYKDHCMEVAQESRCRSQDCMSIAYIFIYIAWL